MRSRRAARPRFPSSHPFETTSPSTDTGKLFKNLNTDVPTISGTDGMNFGFEGDGVQFGIDANRPLTTAITAVFIDANVVDTGDDGEPDVAGAKKSQIFNSGWQTGLMLGADPMDEGYVAEVPMAVDKLRGPHFLD